MSKPEYDICVIGGGAGGLVVAAGGATLGARVILIEKNRLGGDCLHYGCVPSKTLLHSARVAQTLRDADRHGIPAAQPEVRIDRVMSRVRAVIGAIEVHDSPERFRGLGVEVVFGAGRFVSPTRFEVEGRTITARAFVIATGSRPAIPTVPGLDATPHLTNENLFSLSEQVDHLLVMGGGPIGLEMAQAFRRLGSQVSLLERSPQVLPREDADLAAVVAERLSREGVRLLCNSTAARVEGQAGDIRLGYEDGEGQAHTLHGSHLLVAAGRKANVEGLGLDQAGVELEQGRIKTDRRLRSSNRAIYACGDVTGPYQFTHMAEHQAGVILRNVIFRLPARVEQRAVPWCTFTDPELARVGLSGQEARQRDIPHRVYTFPFEDIDRAQAEGETAGMAKIVTDPKGRLLGAALAGPHAGELIHEYTLAIARGMKAADLSSVIHIYPTLAQINRRVADQRLKERLTPARKKWIQRLFRLRGS